jgi:hypothetical protein
MSALRSVAVLGFGWIVLAGGSLKFAEAQQVGNESVIAGGRTIVFPTPKGFASCDGINAEWDSAVAAMDSTTTRQLIAFSPPEVITAIRNQQPTGLARRFSSQIQLSTENQEVSEQAFREARVRMHADFEKTKSGLDESIKRLVNKGDNRQGDHSGVDGSPNISDAAFFGFFEDSPAGLGYSYSVSWSDNANGKPERGVIAVILTPVNGRLLFLYAASPYKEEEDRKWAKQAVSGWRDAVVSANPRIASRVKRRIDIGRSFQTALIAGAVAGIVAGAIKWAYKRFHKPKTPDLEPD